MIGVVALGHEPRPRPLAEHLLVRPDETGQTPQPDPEFRHIVVPLDGSADAERALEFALGVGELFNARYTLLRVMMLLAYTPHYDTVPDYMPELASPMSRDGMERYLEDTAAPLRARGLTVATEVLQHASAPTAIIDYAKQHGGALIAMTTSGAGGVRRMLLGSVADKVIRGAETPVLVCNVHQMPEHGTAMAPGMKTASARPSKATAGKSCSASPTWRGISGVKMMRRSVVVSVPPSSCS